jgi:PPOX class probable F420-dependent enzyme
MNGSAEPLRRRVERARVGHLATTDARGRPHVVPLCFALVGEIAYSAVDHKPKKGSRLRRLDNVAATGRACLLVDAYDEDWSRLWWVRLDGRARVVEDPAEAARALDALAAKYPQYAQRRPTGAVLALEITRWSGWSAAAPGDAGGSDYGSSDHGNSLASGQA